MVKFIKNIFFVFILVINTSFADNDYPFAIPEINVSSYALLDVKTGSIIAGKRLDKKVEPASLTKIATLYLVFKSLDSKYISEDEYAIVSKKAWKMPGSRMFVEVGKKVQIKDISLFQKKARRHRLIISRTLAQGCIQLPLQFQY